MTPINLKKLWRYTLKKVVLLIEIQVVELEPLICQKCLLGKILSGPGQAIEMKINLTIIFRHRLALPIKIFDFRWWHLEASRRDQKARNLQVLCIIILSKLVKLIKKTLYIQAQWGVCSITQKWKNSKILQENSKCWNLIKNRNNFPCKGFNCPKGKPKLTKTLEWTTFISVLTGNNLPRWITKSRKKINFSMKRRQSGRSNKIILFAKKGIKKK